MSDDDAPDDETPDDDEASDDDVPLPGYAWSARRQEAELPAAELRAHRAILDEMEEEDLDALDLSRAGDYVLWAAAQALDELDRREEAGRLLQRLADSAAPHPALHYPDILFFHAGLLKDAGDYDAALVALERAEGEDPDLAGDCRERRAEILVLRGREDEGRRLFESEMRRRDGDPWLPLTAAWAFLQAADYREALAWSGRAETALRRGADRGSLDEQDARDAAAEIDRVREEAGARDRRRAEASGSGRDAILALLDAEEKRLVREPPRDPAGRAGAEARLRALAERASRAWDDAVEADDREGIALYDDLRWEIASLADRFGIPIESDS